MKGGREDVSTGDEGYWTRKLIDHPGRNLQHRFLLCSEYMTYCPWEAVWNSGFERDEKERKSIEYDVADRSRKSFSTCSTVSSSVHHLVSEDAPASPLKRYFQYVSCSSSVAHVIHLQTSDGGLLCLSSPRSLIVWRLQCKNCLLERQRPLLFYIMVPLNDYTYWRLSASVRDDEKTSLGGTTICQMSAR